MTHDALQPAGFPGHRCRCGGRRGFSLIESLIATTVLGVITLALASAMATAQKMSFEGQKRMLAAIAASDLVAEFTSLPYDQLAVHDGRSEGVGKLLTLDGHAYPESFWTLGRTTTIEPETIWEETLEISIDGMMITVDTHDSEASLAVMQLFIPEPAE
ncbi:MAG: prepilin-type N-terminal cleavage/methylation domain-containing protein [Phycisphaerales bacterium]|nr:prepilin-type N-terminal cleavage/methylation domain-containing protein [Phycisphaerales bacterium]